MASSSSSSSSSTITIPAVIPGLSDREACIDAVVRTLQALDEGDAALLESAWSASDAAEWDMRDLARMGLLAEGEAVLRGRAGIVRALMRSVGTGKDTWHMASNFRVLVRAPDGTAALRALALAQHYARGDGRDVGKVGALMASTYHADLVRERDGVWRLVRFAIRCSWWEGDKGVFGL